MSRTHHPRANGRLYHALGLPRLFGSLLRISRDAWLCTPGARRWGRREVSHARRRADKAAVTEALSDLHPE